MIDQAVAKYGVRSLARELGVSPGYVSMLARGQRAMTEELLEAIEGLVNTQPVHKGVPGRARSAPRKQSDAWWAGQDLNL
jgi:transcriptional regulator with XRE-family HTH domain